jgi:hypothetical protein
MSSQAKTYTSNDTIDMVIAAGTIQPSVSNATYDTGVGQYGYPLGVYSTDGGSTWNDCWGAGQLFDNSFLGVNISCDSSGVLHFNNGPSNIIKFVLLATDSPSPLNAPTSTTLGGNVVAYQTGNVAYREILASATINGINDGVERIIAHGQSGVPVVAAWTKGFTGSNNITPFVTAVQLKSSPTIDTDYFLEDGTNLYIHSPAGATTYNTAYYRLYDEVL